MSCSLLEKQICEVHPQFLYNVNCIYSKDAIVLKDGVIFISLKDCNMANLEDRDSWAKLDIKGFKIKIGVDSAPVGTVLTVPKDTSKFGYIDYVEGRSFNKSMYPKLYSLFGSNIFPALDAANVGDNLPLGSIIHVMDDETIPTGWKKWEVKANNLAGTDLIKLFKKLSRNTSDSNMKQLYDNAIALNTFPDLEDFFLRAGINVNSVIGSFVSDTVAFNASFKLLPLVLSDDTLNPLACSVGTNSAESASIMYGETNIHQCESSCGVTAGVKGIKLKEGCTSAKSTVVKLSGNGTETTPKHLVTHIAVKVVDKVTKVSGNFKQIIKGFDTLDTDVEEAVLKISTAFNEFGRTTDEFNAKVEALKEALGKATQDQDLINKAVQAFIKAYNEQNLDGKLGNGLTGKGTIKDKLGLKVNNEDFTFDPDGSLRLATKATHEVLNLNKAIPTLGMTTFHGFINNKTQPNKFVIGVPRDPNVQDNGTTASASVIGDLVGQQDYDFIGYQLASSVEVMQYFINDGVTYVRTNDAGMGENGVLNDPNRWGDWHRTDNAQIPFNMINNHTAQIADLFRELTQDKNNLADAIKNFNDAIKAVKTDAANALQTQVTELSNALADKENEINALREALNNAKKASENELNALKSNLDTPCTIGIKTVGDYTVENTDNTLLCTGGVISVPNTITVGRTFNVIATTPSKVTLKGVDGMRLIPPADGSLELADRDTIVTVIITAPNEGRVFGQTE